MITIHNSSKDGRFVRLSFGDSGGDSFPVWGGISNIISAGIGAGASHYAARKYLQGVRETNEMNLKLAHEQQAWDLAQWNRENEYNSAAAQLERWQKAGFSPQSFIGNTDVGNAASLQSPTLANQQAPGDLSGYAQSFAQSIQSGVKGVLDWKQLKLDQDQLNLNKQRLANETNVAGAQKSYYEAMTDQAKANVKFIQEQAKFTEQERYLSNARLEKTWQEFEQSAKLFPHVFSNASSEAKQKALDYLFSMDSYKDRLRSVALENGWTSAQTYKTVKEGIYWAWQGKEGQFQFDTQDLRWSILRTNRDQLQFNLNFDKDTRYSSWTFDRWMRGIDAAAKVGHLIIDGVGEVRQWLRPGNWLGNTSTWFDYNDKGRLEHVERSFTPYKRY